MKNIACNLIYNNGSEDIYVGFNKACDIKNIIYNIEKGKGRWCNQPDCSCKQYYDKGFKGNVDEYPCNESVLFKDWSWTPGNEFKTGKPFRIINSGKGKYAILTTCFPNATESERKIVGFLKIKDIVNDNHKVIGMKQESLRLTLDEAKALDFWLYHSNKKNEKKPIWKTRRFRYLDDFKVAAILHDLLKVVQNTSSQSLILKLLKSDLPDFSETRPDVKGAIKGSYTKNIFLQRKYGKGGESTPHKKLKEYVAKNPHLIGLTPAEFTPRIEHLFISGDLVDILFEPKNGINNIVVEIELDNVLPGIHQAIKYRALRCSQLKRPLNDKNVKAKVVAWSFTENEKKLCQMYNIDFYDIKL